MAKPRYRIVATWLWRRGGWLIPASILAGLLFFATFHGGHPGLVSAILVMAGSMPALAIGSRDPAKVGVSRRLGNTWRDHFYGSRIVLLTALSPILLAGLIWKLRRDDGLFATVHLMVGLLVCASLIYNAMLVFGRKSLFAQTQFHLFLGFVVFLQPGIWGSGLLAWMALALAVTVTFVFSLALTAKHWRATTKERTKDYRVSDMPKSHWLFVALFLLSIFASPRYFGVQVESARAFLLGGLVLGLLLLLAESLRTLREEKRAGGVFATR